MPALIQLYIRQILIGFGLSAVFVTLLFWFNVGNLWHLVTHTEEGWIAAIMLFVFNGIVFSGVQFGMAIMRLADNEDDNPRGGKRLNIALTPAQHPDAIPVPVASDTPRR